MDYGFMRASTSDYTRRDKSKDRVVQSYDGYSSYLLIVDEATRFVWVFLTNSKSPSTFTPSHRSCRAHLYTQRVSYVLC
jgi:hypothetical protein